MAVNIQKDIEALRRKINRNPDAEIQESRSIIETQKKKKNGETEMQRLLVFETTSGVLGLTHDFIRTTPRLNIHTPEEYTAIRFDLNTFNKLPCGEEGATVEVSDRLGLVSKLELAITQDSILKLRGVTNNGSERVEFGDVVAGRRLYISGNGWEIGVPESYLVIKSRLGRLLPPVVLYDPLYPPKLMQRPKKI